MKSNTDERVDISSVNKTKKQSIISKLFLKVDQKNKTAGPGRDEIGRFTSGSGGTTKSPTISLGRIAPVVVLIALIGGFLVFTSNAATTSSAKVTEWYNTCHSRAPDAGGLAYWKGRLDKGESENGVFAAFVAAGGCTPKPKNTTTTPATPATPANPVQQTEQPATDPRTGRNNNAPIEDDKTHSLSVTVKSAYRSVMGKNPSYDELSKWIKRVNDANLSYNQLITELKATPHYSTYSSRSFDATKYAHLTNEEFVEAIYFELWDHVSNPADMKLKTQQLDKGEITREQLYKQLAATGNAVARNERSTNMTEKNDSDKAARDTTQDEFYKIVADQILDSLPSGACKETADKYRRGIVTAWMMFGCAGQAGLPPVTGTNAAKALGDLSRGVYGSVEEAVAGMFEEARGNPYLVGCSYSDTTCQQDNYRDHIFCKGMYAGRGICAGRNVKGETQTADTSQCSELVDGRLQELCYETGSQESPSSSSTSTQSDSSTDACSHFSGSQQSACMAASDKRRSKNSQSQSQQNNSTSTSQRSKSGSATISEQVRDRAKQVVEKREKGKYGNTRQSDVVNESYAEISEEESDVLGAMVIPECEDDIVEQSEVSSGNCIKRTQQILNIIDDSEIPVSGKLDKNTSSKIKKFQSSRNIKATGKIDKKTRRLLNAGLDRSVYRSPMSPSRGFMMSYRVVGKK